MVRIPCACFLAVANKVTGHFQVMVASMQNVGTTWQCTKNFSFKSDPEEMQNTLPVVVADLVLTVMAVELPLAIQDILYLACRKDISPHIILYVNYIRCFRYFYIKQHTFTDCLLHM